jgi:hypothetical protein
VFSVLGTESLKIICMNCRLQTVNVGLCQEDVEACVLEGFTSVGPRFKIQ